MISRREFLSTFFGLTMFSVSVAADSSVTSELKTIKVKNTKIQKTSLKKRKKKKLALNNRVSKSHYLLKMYNPNTIEVLVVRIPKNGKISKNKYKEINWFLRDFHENMSAKIDKKLILYMAKLLEKTKKGRYIVVHSAYRTNKTNRMLREHGYKTATKSMHIKAKAVDFHISGFSPYKSYLIAKKLNPGGLGYYKKQKFVHMDTGHRRFWFS